MQENSTRKIRQVLTDPRRARNLAAHVWKHFQEDRCLDEAASLSYTSLLSLVPLLAVVFGIASAFPVFEVWSENFKQFIFSNMVPDSSVQVQEYLEEFLGSVNKLTLTGFFVLIITALMLMVRIERSFNRIWRVPVPRSLVSKITIYWAVLTLGPLALGAATALSAQTLIEFVSGDVISAGMLRALGVFMLTWLAFWLMFVLVPNCRVPLSYAALGSLVSTLLFTLAKTGFVAYVSRASYSVIYGAMATVPLFLLWLYIVWTVILLGASLAASLTTFSDRGTDWRWPAAWEFLLVYRLLGHLFHAHRTGQTLSTAELLDLEPGIPSSRLQGILQELLEQGLVTQDRDDGWLLKRDLASYTLRDLYLAGDYHLPIGKDLPVPSGSPWDPPFLTLLNEKDLNMNRSLASMYEKVADPGEEQAAAEAAA